MKSKMIFAMALIAGLSVPAAVAQRGSHAPAISHSMGTSRGMSGSHQPGGPNGGKGGGASAMQASGKSASDLLTQNTKLAAKLEGILKLTGSDTEKLDALKLDAAGFKNLGQFVAAVHVSQNLGITFDQLKSTMLDNGGMSLGKAISQLKPEANTKTETKKANTQAQSDLADGGQGS